MKIHSGPNFGSKSQNTAESPYSYSVVTHKVLLRHAGLGYVEFLKKHQQCLNYVICVWKGLVTQNGRNSILITQIMQVF